MHHYFNICWLSFTNHFLNQLQYLIITFLCTFDYSNNLINQTSLAPISSDNQRSTVLTWNRQNL